MPRVHTSDPRMVSHDSPTPEFVDHKTYTTFSAFTWEVFHSVCSVHCEPHGFWNLRRHPSFCKADNAAVPRLIGKRSVLSARRACCPETGHLPVECWVTGVDSLDVLRIWREWQLSFHFFGYTSAAEHPRQRALLSKQRVGMRNLKSGVGACGVAAILSTSKEYDLVLSWELHWILPDQHQFHVQQ